MDTINTEGFSLPPLPALIGRLLGNFVAFNETETREEIALTVKYKGKSKATTITAVPAAVVAAAAAATQVPFRPVVTTSLHLTNVNSS